MNTKHFNFAANRLLGNLEDLAALHTCNAQFDSFKPISASHDKDKTLKQLLEPSE